MRTLLLVLALAACGDGGDGDGDGEECLADVRCFRLTMGVGTGTCDDAMVRDAVEPELPVYRAEGACGPESISFDAGETCSVSALVELELVAGGPTDGMMAIEGDCAPGGVACEHAYQVTFYEIGCATASE